MIGSTDIVGVGVGVTGKIAGNDTFDLGIGNLDVSIVVITGISGVGDDVDTVDLGIGIFYVPVVVTGADDGVFDIVGNDIIGIIGLCGLCESSCSKRSCTLGRELGVIDVLGIRDLGLRGPCGPGGPCGPCRPGGPGGIINPAGIFIPPTKLSLISFNNFITPSSF